MSEIAIGKLEQRFGFTNAGCINCGYDANAFTAVGNIPGGKEVAPKAGDATLCIKCGELQVVNDAGDGFRKATEVELAQLDRDGRVVKMREALKKAEAHGGVKSVSIVKGGAGMTPTACDLSAIVHDACMAHFGISRDTAKGFTEDQILDMASAGATLASAYLSELPYNRRLEVTTNFVEKLLQMFKGKGPRS